MLHSVLGKTLFDYRRSIIWWSLGFLAMSAYIIVLFPSVRDNPAMQALANSKLEIMKALIGNVDFGSPVGYMTGGLFSLTLPMLFMFFTIPAGANAISGEEAHKTMDLLLANPVSRRRVVLEKFGAMALLTLLLGVVTWLAMIIGGPQVNLLTGGLSAATLAAGLFSAVLLGLFFGTLALAIGAMTGSRGMALGITAGVAVANYLVKSMAANVGAMNSLQKALPMYYFLSDDYNPLSEGLNLGYAAVLLIGIIVLLGVALFTFERRDVAV